MKWDKLDTLTRPELNTVRHGYGRKCDGWSEAEDEIRLTQALVDKLGVLVMKKGSSPMEQLPSEFTNSIFIARLPDNRMYVVNTEGFMYCRYIANLVIMG